jgi:hypothetical protein
MSSLLSYEYIKYISCFDPQPTQSLVPPQYSPWGRRGPGRTVTMLRRDDGLLHPVNSQISYHANFSRHDVVSQYFRDTQVRRAVSGFDVRGL